MKKTILITGSTDGIGKLAAIKLAKENHEVYIHGRNADKLETVIAEVKDISNNDNVVGYIADFSDLNAVKGMAKKINEEIPNLDVLINNAGVYKSSAAKGKEGLDIRFVVNYLAPYLLTRELLPLLKKGKAPRVINLSSAAQSPVSMEALLGKGELPTQASYAQSKLALTMWSLHLAETEPELTVIPVNPGSLLNTRMVKEGFGFHRSPADKGRDILYDLAVLDKFENMSGQYFDNDIGAFGRIHPDGNRRDKVKKLIEITNEVLE